MTWQANASSWEDRIEDLLGNSRPNRWSEIWLIDLPPDPDDLEAHRGILFRGLGEFPADKDLGDARNRAHALNEAEDLARACGGSVDYARFAPHEDDKRTGRLLTGAALVTAWRPGDSDPDLLAHLRGRVLPVGDLDDIPFPPAGGDSP